VDFGFIDSNINPLGAAAEIKRIHVDNPLTPGFVAEFHGELLPARLSKVAFNSGYTFDNCGYEPGIFVIFRNC
jgi:hypothetical protein